MELIESDKERNQGPLPEPEPRYQTTTLPVEKTEHGQTWVRLAVSLVAAVVLIILIILLARWIYHKAHNHSGPGAPAKSPAVSVNNPAKKQAASSNESGNSSGSSSTSNSTSSNSSGSSAASNSNSSSAAQITNTGPGDVAAIFVGASLAAGGLHYLISIRRFARNS